MDQLTFIIKSPESRSDLLDVLNELASYFDRRANLLLAESNMYSEGKCKNERLGMAAMARHAKDFLKGVQIEISSE